MICAIRSIQNQTWQDWELVIVDDGSQDSSYSLCEEEARKDRRIKLFKNEHNLGLAKTMNRLVSLSKGNYMAVQEQDDYSLPDRLEKELKLLDAKPKVGIVSGIAAWVDKDGKLLAHYPGILVRGEQYPQNLQEMVEFLYVEQCKVVNAACMIRRSVMDRIEGPFDPDARISIDWQFFLRAAHFTKIWGIPEVLVHMSRDQTQNNLTKQKDIQFSEARRCIAMIYEDFRNDPQSPINKHLYKRALVTQQLLECRHDISLRGFSLFLKSIWIYPGNPKVWDQLEWYWQKARHKLLHDPKEA